MNSFAERQLNKTWLPIRLVIVSIVLVLQLIGAVAARIGHWIAIRPVGIRRVGPMPISAQEARRQVTSSLKTSILKRDRYTCQLCGNGRHTGHSLNVDHWLSIKWFPQLAATSWNLVTLCAETEPGKADGGCNGAKSDELPSMVIDWDTEPARELMPTAVIIQISKEHDVNQVVRLLRAVIG